MSRWAIATTLKIYITYHEVRLVGDRRVAHDQPAVLVLGVGHNELPRAVLMQLVSNPSQIAHSLLNDGCLQDAAIFIYELIRNRW